MRHFVAAAIVAAGLAADPAAAREKLPPLPRNDLGAAEKTQHELTVGAAVARLAELRKADYMIHGRVKRDERLLVPEAALEDATLLREAIEFAGFLPLEDRSGKRPFLRVMFERDA